MKTTHSAISHTNLKLNNRQLMKKIIEKWAVNLLYINNFTRFGRINKKRRRIIFTWQGRILFSIFPSRKEMLAVQILEKWYGYTFWEHKPTWCSITKPQIDHTWGEVQDIIRSYNTIPSPKALSRLVSNQYSSEPKSDVLPVTPQDNINN